MREEEGELPQDKNIDVQPNQQVEGTAGPVRGGEAAGMLSAEQCTPAGKTRKHIHTHTHTRHFKPVVIFPHDSVKNKTRTAAASGRRPRADARQPSLICTLSLSSGRMWSRPPHRPPLCPGYSAVSQRPPTSGSLFIRGTCVYRFQVGTRRWLAAETQGSSMNA